jgi:anti-anti-sigma factor
MDMTTTLYTRCGLVKAIGRIDSESAPGLEEEFRSVLSGKKDNIVFDMSEVNFVSSRGIWVLLETQKACKKAHGELVIAQANEDIVKSLDLAGVKHFIKLFDDVLPAVASF